MEQKRKLLYWEGSSKKDFKEFPTDVQKDMGVALFSSSWVPHRIRPNPGKGWVPGCTNWWRIIGAIPSGRSIP